MNSVNNRLVFDGPRVGFTPTHFSEMAPVLKAIFFDVIAESPKTFNSMILVSKEWNRVGADIYNERYQRIAPHLIKAEDFLECIGGDPGKEPLIPLEYLIQFRAGKTLLNLFPKSLAFRQDDGTVVEEPCTINNMGKWALKAKTDHPIGFDSDSWVEAMSIEKPVDKSFWSFMEMVSSKGNTMVALDERVGVTECSLALLMTYLKTGVPLLKQDKMEGNIEWAFVAEKIEDWQVVVGFTPLGLRIDSDEWTGTSYEPSVYARNLGLKLINSSEC